ncbi:MAG: hypothetical protein QM783_17165 [Phycisphaerales bacterium]
MIVAGPLFATAAQSAEPGAILAVEPQMNDETARRIAAFIKPGDAVLIKGSRSQAMERVADAVAARFATASPSARSASLAPRTVSPAGPKEPR